MEFRTDCTSPKGYHGICIVTLHQSYEIFFVIRKSELSTNTTATSCKQLHFYYLSI